MVTAGDISAVEGKNVEERRELDRLSASKYYIPASTYTQVEQNSPQNLFSHVEEARAATSETRSRLEAEAEEEEESPPRCRRITLIDEPLTAVPCRAVPCRAVRERKCT